MRSPTPICCYARFMCWDCRLSSRGHNTTKHLASNVVFVSHFYLFYGSNLGSHRFCDRIWTQWQTLKPHLSSFHKQRATFILRPLTVHCESMNLGVYVCDHRLRAPELYREYRASQINYLMLRLLAYSMQLICTPDLWNTFFFFSFFFHSAKVELSAKFIQISAGSQTTTWIQAHRTNDTIEITSGHTLPSIYWTFLPCETCAFFFVALLYSATATTTD